VIAREPEEDSLRMEDDVDELKDEECVYELKKGYMLCV
jgi:hypothetical protein